MKYLLKPKKLDKSTGQFWVTSCIINGLLTSEIKSMTKTLIRGDVSTCSVYIVFVIIQKGLLFNEVLFTFVVFDSVDGK